jgi:BioD-like phosphotransacetylase family protein
MTGKLCELLPNIAVINAGAVTLTVDVVTVKFALDKPVVMLTDAGTVAAARSLDRLTVVVPEAAPLRVTVQVDVVGGVTVDGVQLKPESTGTTG